MRTAREGTEIFYPKKLDAAGAVVLLILALSLAECFRDEIFVRLLAGIGVLGAGGFSFYALRNLFLVFTNKAWLTLSPAGLSCRYGKSAFAFRWRDIRAFSVVQIQPPDGKLRRVGVTLNDGIALTDSDRRAKQAAQAITKGRFDGLLLPDAFDWNPADLADYLSQQRERHAPPAA
jgi:hypothetical protein